MCVAYAQPNIFRATGGVCVCETNKFMERGIAVVVYRSRGNCGVTIRFRFPACLRTLAKIASWGYTLLTWQDLWFALVMDRAWVALLQDGVECPAPANSMTL